MTLGSLAAMAACVAVSQGGGDESAADLRGRAGAVRVVTDGRGARVMAQTASLGVAVEERRVDGGSAPSDGPAPARLIWAHDEPLSIPQSVAFGAGGGGVWGGQGVNERRAQWFTVPGAGAPEFAVALGGDSPARVAAAADLDRAVVLDHDGAAFSLRGVRSAGRPMAWVTSFKGEYSVADAQASGLSRNGKVAAVCLTDPGAGESALFILDGATGEVRTTKTFAGPGGSVDLTDDGSLCLVSQGGTARLIDAATGEQVFSAPANGAGGRPRISGDGGTLVVGALDLRVYVRVGATYQLRIQFEQPGWWFGWGAAVSRDGKTVGVMGHDAAGGYQRTATRIFDVPSAALLGTHLTQGSGAFEDAVSGAAISDDGRVFAVCSWGTEDGAHPEVMVFDRGANLVASLDTEGSPFALDLSRDGRFVSVGSKSVHANVFGVGGTIFLVSNPWACYADCDADGGLSAADFGCFQSRFVVGLPGADCDGDALLTAADFSCFQSGFVNGCP